jgi:hypothetical protein
LFKGVEGKGIDKKDLDVVKKARESVLVKGVGINTLDNRIQVFSQNLVDSRHQAVLPNLRRHKLPPSAYVDLDVESTCFDELDQESVRGRYDVFFVSLDDNSRKIMEIKVSDPELYKKYSGHSLREAPIDQKHHYDLLQLTLYNLMERSRYRDIDMPKITAELFVVNVGKPSKRIELLNGEKDKEVGLKLFEDVVKLRENGLEKFKTERGIK